VARAPLYKKGPAQMANPDAYLTRDQAGTIVGTKLGYTHVITDEGLEGYIAASKLRPGPPLPPPLKPATTADSLARFPGTVPEPALPGSIFPTSRPHRLRRPFQHQADRRRVHFPSCSVRTAPTKSRAATPPLPSTKAPPPAAAPDTRPNLATQSGEHRRWFGDGCGIRTDFVEATSQINLRGRQSASESDLA